MTSSCRLLFLFADTGGGHRSAATAVACYLDRIYPGRFGIDLLDPFAEAKPRWVGSAAGLYGPLSRKAG